MSEYTGQAAQPMDLQTAMEAKRDAGELEVRCNAAAETLDGVVHMRAQLGELVARLTGPTTDNASDTPPRAVRAGLIGQLTDTQERMDEEIRGAHELIVELQRLI